MKNMELFNYLVDKISVFGIPHVVKRFTNPPEGKTLSLFCNSKKFAVIMAYDGNDNSKLDMYGPAGIGQFTPDEIYTRVFNYYFMNVKPD